MKRALANPDNRPPRVFARDRLRSYPAAIRELQNEGQIHRNRHRTRPYSNNRIESDHRLAVLGFLWRILCKVTRVERAAPALVQ